MDIRVTCRHCDVSKELREYTLKKVERLQRRFDGIHSVEVVLSKEGGKQKAECIVGVVRGRRCVAEQIENDLFAAVDIVVDKMDRQIGKLKGKLRRTHGKSPERPTATEGE